MKLLLSEAPLVNIISLGFALIRAATGSRAFSTAFSAFTANVTANRTVEVDAEDPTKVYLTITIVENKESVETALFINISNITALDGSAYEGNNPLSTDVSILYGNYTITYSEMSPESGCTQNSSDGKYYCTKNAKIKVKYKTNRELKDWVNNVNYVSLTKNNLQLKFVSSNYDKNTGIIEVIY